MSLETDAMLKQLQAEKDRNANELNEKINALSQELSKASRLLGLQYYDVFLIFCLLEDQKALHSDELGIMQKENDEVNARLNVMTEEICHFKSHDSDIVLERNEAIQKYEEIVSSFEKLKEVIAANVKEIANLEHVKFDCSFIFLVYKI
jgi:uncharacterized coiled-coil DUF342 family protein